MNHVPSPDDKIGVMLCGHGSRDTDAIREFQVLVDKLKVRLPDYMVESGFLEFAAPVIHEGFDKLKAAGVKHVLALPGDCCSPPVT